MNGTGDMKFPGAVLEFFFFSSVENHLTIWLIFIALFPFLCFTVSFSFEYYGIFVSSAHFPATLDLVYLSVSLVFSSPFELIKKLFLKKNSLRFWCFCYYHLSIHPSLVTHSSSCFFTPARYVYLKTHSHSIVARLFYVFFFFTPYSTSFFFFFYFTFILLFLCSLVVLWIRKYLD
jgi:hypothetical protein